MAITNQHEPVVNLLWILLIHCQKDKCNYDLSFKRNVNKLFLKLQSDWTFYVIQKANELLTAAQTRGGAAFAFKNEQGRIQRELQAARKDNDFIYHDKIPDLKTLPAIGKAAIAKPTAFPTKPMSEKFTGLLMFVSLFGTVKVLYLENMIFSKNLFFQQVSVDLI